MDPPLKVKMKPSAPSLNEEHTSEDMGANTCKSKSNAPTFNVRNVSDGSTWTFPLTGDQTVKGLKTAIQSAHTELKNKRLRLIFQGRLLLDSQTLLDCGLKENSFVHCAASDANIPPSTASASTPANRDDTHVTLGFERLRIAGFSRTEVDELRMHYHGRIPRNAEEEQAFRRLEETWMQGDDIETGNARSGSGLHPSGTIGEDLPIGASTLTPTERRRGSPAEFILGFFVGMFFGVFGLIWLIDRTASNFQRLGILTGVTASFLLSGWTRFGDQAQAGQAQSQSQSQGQSQGQ